MGIINIKRIDTDLSSSIANPHAFIDPLTGRRQITAQDLLATVPSSVVVAGEPEETEETKEVKETPKTGKVEEITETDVVPEVAPTTSVSFTPMEKVGLRLYDKYVDRLNQGILSDELLERQRIAESGGNQFFTEEMLKRNAFKDKGYDTGTMVTSHSGALGIAQFMPKTWKSLKDQGIIPKSFDVRNEEDQKKAQAIYMAYLHDFKYDKSVDELGLNRKRLAVASYNTGMGNVQKAVRAHGKDWDKHLAEETTNYLPKIIDIDMSK